MAQKQLNNKSILKEILEEFLKWSCTTRRDRQKIYQSNIRALFKSSTYRDPIIRSILNGAVLSDEEKLRLLNIIYFKNYGD